MYRYCHVPDSIIVIIADIAYPLHTRYTLDMSLWSALYLIYANDTLTEVHLEDNRT
jgi:hypothetical protein